VWSDAKLNELHRRLNDETEDEKRDELHCSLLHPKPSGAVGAGRILLGKDTGLLVRKHGGTTRLQWIADPRRPRIGQRPLYPPVEAKARDEFGRAAGMGVFVVGRGPVHRVVPVQPVGGDHRRAHESALRQGGVDHPGPAAAVG
jgi:hypothetical protein